MTDSKSGPVPSLIEGFLKLHPQDAARVIENSDSSEAAAIIAHAEPEASTAVLGSLTPEFAASVLRQMDSGTAPRLLQMLEPARGAALLSRLDDEPREALLSGMEPVTAKALRELMAFPPGSAGSLMDTRVHTFRPDATVGLAIQRLRGSGRRIHDVFIVGPEGRLTGMIPIESLAVADHDEQLSNLARGAPVSVLNTAGQEEVAEILEQQRLLSLPVVDFDGRIVGVIRHQALVEILEKEVSADIGSMVGVSREERALSKVSFSVRKRLPWLHINLGTAFLAAAVVGLFEGTIARYTALAVLLPVVAGQSGNTGSQALAVTLRGLALREIRTSHWFRVTLKEASVGMINGIAIAVITSLGVYIWSRSAGLSLVIAIAMVISMAIAGVTGALIPLALDAAGQDPAQSSSIVLTTVTDVTGFFSFLGLATLFASML